MLDMNVIVKDILFVFIFNEEYLFGKCYVEYFLLVVMYYNLNVKININVLCVIYIDGIYYVLMYYGVYIVDYIFIVIGDYLFLYYFFLYGFYYSEI